MLKISKTSLMTMMMMMMIHLKASISEMRESGALEGDQAGAVGGQCHQALRISSLICICIFA